MGPLEPSVLVVDDDDDIREAIGAILTFKGYRVVEAVDGADALRQVRSGIHLFLILLDLRMPRMSGEEFKAALDSDPAVARAPVVVCSGDGTIGPRAAAMGAAEYLKKPFEMFELITLVRRYRELGGGAAN